MREDPAHQRVVGELRALGIAVSPSIVDSWSGEAAKARYDRAQLAGWIPLIPIDLVFASRSLERYTEEYGGLPIALPEGGLRFPETLAELGRAYAILVLHADRDGGPAAPRERERDPQSHERIEGA